MSWLYAARVREPEAMNESGEAERYAGVAAERHLAGLQAKWKRPA